MNGSDATAETGAKQPAVRDQPPHLRWPLAGQLQARRARHAGLRVALLHPWPSMHRPMVFMQPASTGSETDRLAGETAHEGPILAPKHSKQAFSQRQAAKPAMPRHILS